MNPEQEHDNTGWIVNAEGRVGLGVVGIGSVALGAVLYASYEYAVPIDQLGAPEIPRGAYYWLWGVAVAGIHGGHAMIVHGLHRARREADE